MSKDKVNLISIREVMLLFNNEFMLFVHSLSNQLNVRLDFNNNS